MLNNKDKKIIQKDLIKIFGQSNVIESSIGRYINIVLAENIEITSNDFPHLLTIAKNYNLHISVYPIDSNRLAISLKEV